MDLRGQRPRASASATRPEPELETHWPGWVEWGAGRRARTEWGSERKGWETLGRFWGWGTVHLGGEATKEGMSEGLERWKRKEPRVSRLWAGSEAGTGHGTVSGCQIQHVREGSKVEEGEEKVLRWGWGGPAASIPKKKNRGGLEAGGSGHASQRAPVVPVDVALGSVLAQGCPHWSSVAFALLPIHIYLFIDFYEVSLSSNPNCSCCPDHPRPPAIQLSVCLSQGK